VTDVGMKDVASLPQLRELHLGQTAVTDAGLKELAALRQLQTLGLRQTKVTDAGLQHLLACKQLRNLELQGTQVTDPAIQELILAFSPLKVKTEEPASGPSSPGRPYRLPLVLGLTSLLLVGITMAVVGLRYARRRGAVTAPP